VVPGCSISDQKLMDKEQIEDHGDATVADSKRMIDNIEALNFTSSLIGILRQLVGVDLLRENEVFYLPPTKGRSVQMHRAVTEGKGSIPRLTSRESLGRDVGSADGSRLKPSRKRSSKRQSMASTSPTSSYSEESAASFARSSHGGHSRSDIGVLSGGETNDSGQSPSRRTKRHKASTSTALEGRPQGASVAIPASVRIDKTQSPSGAVIKGNRRSKRLGRDAAEYKPDAESDSDTQDDGPGGARKYNPKPKRSLKRNRTIGDDGGSASAVRRKAKKPRRSASQR
jgi:hypothetical protein